MQGQKFVGREDELSRLKEYLQKTLSKQGSVIFLSGEAGSGKTALLNEFAKQAMSQVLIIKGICNAQTGIGDPYLPFKEILSALVGDIINSLEQGRPSILKNETIVSIEALVNYGPDLINILISRTKLTVLLEQYIEKGSNTKKAKELLKFISKVVANKNTSVVQSRIFEEVFEVLNSISKHYSFVLLFDDLQWADSATISLLFYLSRKIEQSNILLIGTYRPDEILLGRGGERHPLEKTLAEFKHYFGDIIIDLDRMPERSGRAFIDAILDTEPNLFDDNFRESLFHHTKGHALFTIELLESMRENETIYKDKMGVWTTKSTILWGEIPVRIEGIIEERIGRLEPDLQEILSIASVEGEGFTAEVVAHIRELSEKLILRQLSYELEKRHRLVYEQGEIKTHQRRLQRFQFSHALFQQYLYNQLGTGQRRILHEEIAQLLEKLYGGEIDDVLMKLVHHYTESGNEEKAMGFLIKAGDMAAKSYAFIEARIHYKNARKILMELSKTAINNRQYIELIFKYMTVSSSSDNPKEVLELSSEAERLLAGFLASEQLPIADSPLSADWERLARIYLWTGRAYYNSNQLYDAVRHYNKIIPIAQALNNESLVAMAKGLMGRSLATQGQFGKAETVMRQAQETIEKSGSWHDWIWNTEFLSSCLAIQGKITDGLFLAQKGFAKAEEINYPMALAMAHSHLALIFRTANNPEAMLEHSIQATRIAEQSGDRLFVYIGYGLQGWAYRMLGNINEAYSLIKKSIEIRRSLGEKLVRMDWFIAVEAEIALTAGDFQNAIIYAENAIKIAQPIGGIFSQGTAHRVWSQALAASVPHRWDDVESHMISALHFFELGNAIVEIGRTYADWGNLCQNKGDIQFARKHYLNAANQYMLTDLSSDTQNINKKIIQLDGLREISGLIDTTTDKFYEYEPGKLKSQNEDFRKTLTKKFDDPELDSLCIDYFPDVYNKFSRGLHKDEKINILIDFCRRHSDSESKLIEILNKLEK